MVTTPDKDAAILGKSDFFWECHRLLSGREVFDGATGVQAMQTKAVRDCVDQEFVRSVVNGYLPTYDICLR